MSTLRVSDSVLDDLPTALAGAVAQLSFSQWAFRWLKEALQSDTVAAALRDTTSQQVQRADLAALALTALCDFPATVAEQFRATDSLLSREVTWS